MKGARSSAGPPTRVPKIELGEKEAEAPLSYPLSFLSVSGPGVRTDVTDCSEGVALAKHAEDSVTIVARSRPRSEHLVVNCVCREAAPKLLWQQLARPSPAWLGLASTNTTAACLKPTPSIWDRRLRPPIAPLWLPINRVSGQRGAQKCGVGVAQSAGPKRKTSIGKCSGRANSIPILSVGSESGQVRACHVRSGRDPAP